jgi:hypothetical protein
MKLRKPLLVIFCLAILAPAFGQKPAPKPEKTPEWWEQPVLMLRVDHMPDFAEMKNEDMDALARSRVEKWGIDCERIMGALAWGGRGDLTAFETPVFERAPGTGSQNLYPYSMAGKYLRAGDKPAVVFMHYMNGAWHYLLLFPNELKSGLVQTIASGANPWLALVQSSLVSMPQGAEPAKEIFDFLEKNKEYYSGMESAAEVGLLFSARTGRNYISTPEIFARLNPSDKPGSQWAKMTREELASLSNRKKHCEDQLTSSYEGYFHALTRAHVPFDIILDQDLTPEKLARYKVLVLADAVCLTPEAASAIREFVHKGGNLLASYEAGLYDDRGEASTALFDVLGIREVEGAFSLYRGENYVQAISDHWGIAKGRLLERAGEALKVRAADGVDTPSRFLEPLDRPYVPLKGVSEFPALLIHRYGQGTVAYFPEAMGVFIGESCMPSAEMRIGKAVDFLLENPMMTVNAPRTVGVDAYRLKGTNRIAVHLVNNTIDGHPVGEFLPVFGVAFKIRTGARPKKTLALRENKKIEVSYRDGWTEVRLPNLSIYEVVVIELGQGD